MSRKHRRSVPNTRGKIEDELASGGARGEDCGEAAVGADVAARSSRLLRGWSAALFAAAIGVSLFLLRVSVRGEAPPGCGPEGGCGAVLKSQWSQAFGLPVSVYGAGAYAVLFIGAAFLGAPTRGFRRLEIGVSAAVVAGAVWFACVQALILHAFCPWCLVAHAAACLGVAMLWRARRFLSPGQRPDLMAAAWVAVGVVAAAGLAVGQVVAPGGARSTPVVMAQALEDDGSGKISLHGGRLVVDATSLPAVGVPGAPVTAVILTDFTCPHCRELQRVVARVEAERAGRFLAVMLPASHDPSAREVHRLMLAAWRLDAVRYRDLVEGLVEGSINPSVPEVLERLRLVFGKEFHERAWAEAPWIEAALVLGERALTMNSESMKSNILPQVMMRDRLLTGLVTREEFLELIDALPGDGASGQPSSTGAAVAATFNPGSPPQRAASDLGAAMASPVAPKPPVLSPSPPVIEFESTTVELGRVTKGETVAKVVRFTNAGGAPLTIKNIKAGCGCTTVQGGQQSVNPGQQGSFEIKLDTTNFAGPLIKTIDVESNASNPRVKLDLKAEVWSPVKLSAASIAFGNVIKGSEVAPKEVELLVTDSDPLELGPITSANPYFQAQLTPVEPGRRYALRVSVPELGEQPQQGDVVVHLGHAKLKDIKVSAFINPIDPVTIQPRRIVVPVAALAAGTKAVVSVYSHDRQLPDLEVSALSFSGGPSVAVTYEKRPTERWGRIVLAFPAGYSPPAGEKPVLTFRTNHPRFAEVTVPVQFMDPKPAASAR